ncbi:MAG: replicative DNA helicase [Pyrinomonadaceae bacterium]|nr:replicative DNA helicase [Pyrinomonadaceae bacterium]
MASVFPDNRREQYLEKPLPSSEESERVILGAVLLDNIVMAEAIDHLKPEDFYSPFNRRVFAAMSALFTKDSPIDPVLVGEEMKKEGSLEAFGGVPAITNLTFGLPHFSNVEDYIKVVHDKSVVRQLIRACNAITSEALAEEQDADVVLDRAEQQIFDLAEAKTRASFDRIEPIARGVLARIQERRELGHAHGLTGLATGFTRFDELTAGLQRTDLIIVAGRPAMGKTALCLTIAQNAALRSNAVVAIFSLEMSKEQLVTRMIASESHINAARFRTGHLFGNEDERLDAAVATLSEARIFIDDSPAISALEIRAKARRLAAQEKTLDLIVIDYLQLMGTGSRRSENRQQEVSQISRELKALAKDMNVPVLALSQLSRAPEARSPPKPLMSDLRESGSIEQDADVVAFIYREDYYKPSDENQGMADLIIAKQRNGPTGDVRLAFLKEFTRFENFYEA